MPEWVQLLGVLTGSGGFIGLIALLVRVGRWVGQQEAQAAELSRLRKTLDGRDLRSDTVAKDVYDRLNGLQDAQAQLRSDLSVLSEGMASRLRAFERGEDMVSAAVNGVGVLRAQEEELRRRTDALDSRLQTIQQEHGGHRARLENIEKHL